MSAEQLKAYAEEMSAHCIADIERRWSPMPCEELARLMASPKAEDRYEAAKLDWRHSIRYAVAKAAFEAAVRLTPGATMDTTHPRGAGTQGEHQ